MAPPAPSGQATLAHIAHERLHAREQQEFSAEPMDDDWMFETPDQREAASERLSRLKELLTSTVLGTA
jgi:hypothetical protein